MSMRDELGVFYGDQQFAHLFSHTGTTGRGPMATGFGNGDAVRRVNGSPGGRRGTGVYYLEVCSGVRNGRTGISLLGPE